MARCGRLGAVATTPRDGDPTEAGPSPRRDDPRSVASRPTLARRFTLASLSSRGTCPLTSGRYRGKTLTVRTEPLSGLDGERPPNLTPPGADRSRAWPWCRPSSTENSSQNCRVSEAAISGKNRPPDTLARSGHVPNSARSVPRRPHKPSAAGFLPARRGRELQITW